MQDLITAEKKLDIPESDEQLPSIKDIEEDAASDFGKPVSEDKQVKHLVASKEDQNEPKKPDSNGKIVTMNSPHGRPSSLGIVSFRLKTSIKERLFDLKASKNNF